MNQTDIKIGELKEKAKLISFVRPDKYLDTYPVFVECFKSKQHLSNDDVILGIAFVYSWMPRVLAIDIQGIPDLIAAAESYKSSYEEQDVNNLIVYAQKCCAGSLVGASKLLHFIFPDKFPIYDSHVYKYFFNTERAHHYKIKMIDNYLSYRKACIAVADTLEAAELRQIIKQKLTYDVSNIRAIEMCLFYLGKAESAKKKAKEIL